MCGLTALCAETLFAQHNQLLLRPGTTHRLPQGGIELPLPRDSRDDVLPAPRVYTYQMTKGNTRKNVEMYDPRELWHNEQTIGRWSTDNGTRMTLAVIKRLNPTGFERQHVTYEEYLNADTSPLSLNESDPSKKITAWATAYRNKKTVARAPETEMRHFSRLWRLAEPENPFFIGYTFQFSQISASQRFAPDTWFALLFDLPPGSDLAATEREIVRNFLPRISGFRPENNDLLESRSRRFQNENEKDQPTATLRERILSSIRHQQDWWYAESGHYLLISNIGSRHQVMLRSLQKELEELRGGFATLIPPRVQISEVSVLRIFADETDYVRYVGAQLAWSGGLWMPSRRELVVRPLTSHRSRDVREQIRTTAYHEAFHQYLFYALNQRPTSPWFNEGHAMLFEFAEFKNNRLVLQESEQAVELLLNAIDAGRINLSNLMESDYAAFYDENEEQRRLNYAQAWGLIYYLHKDAVNENPNIYNGMLDAYVDLVMKDDPLEATRRIVNIAGIDRLQSSFINFWTNRNLRARARRKDPF